MVAQATNGRPPPVVITPAAPRGFQLTYCHNGSLSELALRWYADEWHRLVNRLRYPGGRKCRRVRARILRHWPNSAWEIAVADAKL